VVLNAFSINMLALPARASFDPLTVDEARELAVGMTSAVGHPDTAAVFAATLGVPVPMNRATVRLAPRRRRARGPDDGPAAAGGSHLAPRGRQHRLGARDGDLGGSPTETLEARFPISLAVRLARTAPSLFSTIYHQPRALMVTLAGKREESIMKCRPFPVRLNRELPATERRRWYVFEDDCGGCIVATVPVELVPASIGKRRLRLVLGGTPDSWSEHDLRDIHVREDFGCVPPAADFDVDPDGYRIFMEALVVPWAVRSYFDEKKFPPGLACAEIGELLKPLETHLAGWKPVGGVSGGMGGGILLDNDAWFHSDVLFSGKDRVNRLRGFMGLAPIETFELTMRESDRWHAELLAAAGASL